MARRVSLAESWTLGIGAGLLLALSAIILVSTPRNNAADVSLFALLLVGLFLLVRSEALPLYVYVGPLAAVTLHALGLVGLFSLRLFGISYDKWLHLAAGAGFFLFFYGALGIKGRWQRIAVAFLCLLGLSAMNEVVEFVGTFWFGFESGGITALAAPGAPASDSPLEAYDTYFDLIFNMAGAALAALVMSFRSLKKRR